MKAAFHACIAACAVFNVGTIACEIILEANRKSSAPSDESGEAAPPIRSMNADHFPNDKSQPSQPESREKRSVLAMLRRAVELVANGQVPFSDEDTLYLASKIFWPQIKSWLDKAGEIHGVEWAEKGTKWERDRRALECVQICWNWFTTPAGEDEDNKRAPWWTILTGAECAERTDAEREEMVCAHIAKGAYRELLDEFYNNESSGKLSAGIRRALNKLKKSHAWVEVKDQNGVSCYRSGDATWPADPALDLECDPAAFDRLVAIIGRRNPSGGKYNSHTPIPPRGKLVIFIKDACREAQLALSDAQLFDLAVRVFDLNLSPVTKIGLEQETDENTDEIIPGLTPDDILADPLADKEDIFCTKLSEPFHVIVEISTRIVQLIVALDGKPIEAPMDGRPREKWLGPLFFRYYLWRDWLVWDDNCKPVCGKDGRPVVYGYARAAALLGMGTATVGDAMSGMNGANGKKAGLLKRAIDPAFGDLSESDRERVENYLRCHYFHMKPAFVDPANFDPVEVLKNLQ